jgi:hypothetical protein
VTIKSRTDLKAQFGINYINLIDSDLNQADDGVFKMAGEPLSLIAAAGVLKPVLRLYSSYPSTNADWLFSLNPAQDPANPATCVPGLGITDGARNVRLFVDSGSGRIGVGTNAPEYALDVVGAARANGFRGHYDDPGLKDYRTVNPKSSVCLYSPPADRDAWIYLDSADTSRNWGIYHRQIDSEIAGLPANSIGFIGGAASNLQAYVNLGDGSAFFSGKLVAGGYAGRAGQVNAGTMEIGGPNPVPDGSGGGLLYLHHHGVIAHQLRYNNGTLFLEAAANGYGTTPRPTLALGGDLSIEGKHAIRGNDPWLRLNPDNHLPSGVYTPGVLRCEGELQMGATLRTPGRMHLASGELCYLLPRDGVIIGKEWGGNGNLTVEGEIAVAGPWVRVAGAGDEQAYFGGDGAANDVQIGSIKAGITTVAAWNWAGGWMDVAGRNWLGHSDARSKENIEPVVGALEKLLRIRCVSFDWKGESGAAAKTIGLVAQEVRDVLPEVVSELRHGSLAIAYNSITALLVEAVKQQQQQIDALRAELTAMREARTP